MPLQAQCTLSCNQGLQVSLDPSGQALITPLLVAPNSGNSCPGPLTVTLYNSVGQTLPNPLNCDQIGQTVTVKVKHTTSGNFCTSTLEVLDALSPTLSNCGDKFIFCHEDPAPAAVGSPSAADNCTASGDLNFSHFDTETSLGCGIYQNGKQVLKRIDRSWTVSDTHGNSSSCLQKIWLRHITFPDISFPLNRDNISSPALDCGQDPNDLGLTGEPTVNGVPVGASPACEMAVSYSDQTIIHCAPAGFTVLRNWTAIDFCSGTLTNRIQIIKVEDKVAPELTAPADITVGTDGFYCTGSVTMPTAVYSDNCSAVTVVPTWEYGSGYGPFSGVTEGEHLVTYTATDACGNVSTALMKVTIVDSSPPQAICGSDLQISLSSNGLGYVNASTVDQGSFDNCGPVFLSISRDEMNYAPQVQVSCADQGTPIMLTLKVTDAVGLENFCQMEVTVRDFLKPAIQCPSNLTLTCLQDYQDLGFTGQATATDNCALLNIVYQDIVNIQPCNIGSVTRWWIATDLAANTKSCSQLITVDVINTTTVSFPANTSVAACGDPAALLPSATGAPIIGGQSCSPLSVNYTDQFFTIAPPSSFRIIRSWKVVDHCIYNPNGGTAGIWEQQQIIDVNDLTPPVAVCLSGLSVTIQPSGSVTLDPHAFDGGSSDLCSPQSSLSFSISPESFDCQHIGLNPVTLTVRDTAGNVASCNTYVSVLDNAHVCTGGVQMHRVAGRLCTETGAAIPRIPVSILGEGISKYTICDTLGYFGFDSLPSDMNYSLQPNNNANWSNGVTTYDLVLISKHILGISPLNSPYKILAADANHSGSVTSFDIVQLRKLILGILDSLPGNTSWRFVDSSYVFPNPLNPFAHPVPEVILIDSLVSNQNAQNFIGLKVGDVNGSTNPSSARSPKDTLFLNFPEQAFAAGETFAVPVCLENWALLDGLQFELNIDPERLEVDHIVFSQPDLLGQSNVALKENGMLALSWDHASTAKSADTAPDARLFTLYLRARTDSELSSSMEISSARLSPEAYRIGKAEPAALAAHFGRTTGQTPNSTLQIFPNPSSGAFFVKNPFSAERSSVYIWDLNGRLVWEKEGDLPAQIAVNSPNFFPPGLYLVELKSAGQTLRGKVVVN